MTENLGVSLLQMMELAGRHLASLSRDRFLHGDARGARVLVLAGAGGNGGGALAAGRRLHGWGARIRTITAIAPESIQGATGHQLAVLRNLGIPVSHWADAASLRTPDLVLDGVIGYGLQDAPREGAAAMIGWVNGVSAPVASLDVPSGLDATTGRPSDPTVLAAATLTLGLPKTGLAAPEAEPHVGELYLGDVGIPASVFAGMGVAVGPVFREGDLIRLA